MKLGRLSTKGSWGLIWALWNFAREGTLTALFAICRCYWPPRWRTQPRNPVLDSSLTRPTCHGCSPDQQASEWCCRRLIGFTICFQNHWEGPYKGLLPVESVYRVSQKKVGSQKVCILLNMWEPGSPRFRGTTWFEGQCPWNQGQALLNP